MSKFLIRKRLGLEFLGEGWQSAYIEFRPVAQDEIMSLVKMEGSFSSLEGEEMEKAAEKIYSFVQELLKTHFLNGEGFTGNDADGKPVMEPITAEDASGELFVEIYRPFLKAARGFADENL